ncbi:endonuclease/exonuclease/phosphatase family protein [Luteolibacter marinus]|uniref:endonuclease/exonuclease/phosphatase family protein n=1 Tax=Luteolibacter marinus TaxID=2776705 RepID=UPI001865A968|nr:endonuclease/exonuclease/phosphatase family protein [Luteolibacter marinus]
MRIAVLFLLLGLLSSCRRTALPKAVPIAEDGALSLTLATFNVRYENPEEGDWRAWPNRIDRVVRSMRTIDPDLFGVQEARHGQAADLRASLPDYDFHGVGRDDGKREGEYAAIFFRRDRFEKLDGGTFWLSDHPEKAGSMTWGNSFPRVASWLRLADRASGQNFHVFNTHWDHRNQFSREMAAPLLAERIDARVAADEPVILLGDFNATEGNPAVDYFTGKSVTLAGKPRTPWKHALIDTYQALHPGVKNRRTLHFWEGHRSGWAKVDHILVSRGAHIEAADIRVEASRQLQPSDHFPVWAKVRWP